MAFEYLAGPDMFYWLFMKNGKYIILSDEELGEEGRRILELEEGYELIWDSATSRQEAEAYAKEFYKGERVKLSTVPVSLKQASAFIDAHHRHHSSPQGHKFSVGLTDGDLLIGAVTAGRPVARHHDDGRTLEITRMCTKSIYRNACSMLYAAIRRIAKEMGYQRVITYTSDEEHGASLKASGYTFIRTTSGGSWNSPSRRRVDRHPTGRKKLWEARLC